MTSKLVKTLLLIPLAFSISGCASFLTLMSPAQSKIVVGEKSVGDFNKYQYHYTVGANGIVFTKTPMCDEMAQTYRKSQKREIGYGPALIEMPFFGLGLLDMVNAYAISENSRKEYPLAKFNTGHLLTCGKPEPAAGESAVIENPRTGLFRKGVTDKQGRLDLTTVLADIPGRTNVLVYLTADPDLRISCVYPGAALAEESVPEHAVYSN